MSEPQQRCEVCGDVEVVRPDGRGFPPDIAKRKLAKRCKAKGHTCQPTYTAGVQTQLIVAMRDLCTCAGGWPGIPIGLHDADCALQAARVPS